MALDLTRVRQKLLARREELQAEDRLSAAVRAPVTLDQDSVGRLSRIDAMQVQAMALAQGAGGSRSDPPLMRRCAGSTRKSSATA